MSHNASRETNNKQENQRQYETIDQSLTMHSALRDMYARRAFWLNTIQIGTSLVLCVFALAGDAVFVELGFVPELARFGLGLCSVIVLLISITEFRVDWKTIGSLHAQAARDLAKIKVQYRRVYNSTLGRDSKSNALLTTQYERTVVSLPPIPEKHFSQLKARHQFKRILSQRLSNNPKSYGWFLRIQLRWEGIKMTVVKEGATSCH